MIIKIIAIVIGVLILGAGLYYLSKEKHDPESKKIYGVISAVALSSPSRRRSCCWCKDMKTGLLPVGSSPVLFDLSWQRRSVSGPQPKYFSRKGTRSTWKLRPRR